MNEYSNAPIYIPPRVRPRDFLDAVLGATVCILQLAILFGLPGWIAFFLTHSAGMAALVVCSAYIGFSAFCVSRISVNPVGIRFHRQFGSPKFLPWERITSVSVASRSELIIHGWLWPIFPAREMTPCFSSLNHFRISWDGGYCYYPPADIGLFERYVASKLTTSQANRE